MKSQISDASFIMDAISPYIKVLWAIAVWREARGESLAAKLGVAYVIFNRASAPGWWGTDLHSVILRPAQFSSFNHGDPNSSKFPSERDTTWEASLDAVEQVLAGKPDPTLGATHYHDVSIAPPEWTKELVETVRIGAFVFYKAS